MTHSDSVGICTGGLQPKSFRLVIAGRGAGEIRLPLAVGR